MKNKILKTAFNLMGKKSIKDVSMNELAKACNITKPALYYYFKDKDEICYTIIKHVLENRNITFKGYLEKNISLKEILFDIFETTFHAKGKKSVGFFLHIIEYVKGVNKLEKKFKPLQEENERIVKKLFNREIKNKTITQKNAEIGYHLFEAALYRIVFMPTKLINNINPQDIALAILKAIDYKSNMK